MPGDLGNDAAIAEARLLAKILELIKELLIKTISPESTLKREQVRNMKVEKKEEKISKALDKKNGEIKIKYLTKCGENLDTFPVDMSQAELEDFDSYGVQYNMPYAVVCNTKNEKEINQIKKELKNPELTTELINQLQNRLSEKEKEREKRVVVIRQKDRGKLNEIISRMNYDIMRENGDKSINELNQEEFKKYNKENENSFFENIYYGKSENIKNFQDAVNMLANRNASTNDTFYMCDRNSPSNFIEVTYKVGNHNSRDFTITKFDVFNNGKKQKCEEFSHGEFTHFSDRLGNNSSVTGEKHWINMKNEMERKSGFVNKSAVIFSSKEDFDKYKEIFLKMKEEENQPKEQKVELGEGYECFVYTEFMDELRDKTVDLTLENNMIKNENTQQYIVYDPNMSDEEKIEYCKSMIMLKQLKNYEILNQLNQKYAEAVNNYINTKDIPDMKDYADKVQKNIIQSRTSIGEFQEIKIILDDNMTHLNSIKASFEKDKHINNSHNNIRGLDEWKKEIDEIGHGVQFKENKMNLTLDNSSSQILQVDLSDIEMEN